MNTLILLAASFILCASLGAGLLILLDWLVDKEIERERKAGK
jgi:hypothetical protein